MDITDLARFRVVVDAARRDAELRGRPDRTDSVWGRCGTMVFEAIADLITHLGVISVTYPHEASVVREHARLLSEAAANVHASLTEPPVCAEGVGIVLADGTGVNVECELRPGHSGNHRANPVERRLLDTTAQLAHDANMLSDGVRRAILDAPGPSSPSRFDAADQQFLGQLIVSAASQLGRIAALLEHRPPILTSADTSTQSPPG